MASLRGQVRTVRYLVLACLALLVVLAVGLGVALAASRAQLDDLTAQVSALSAQAAAQPPAQPATLQLLVDHAQTPSAIFLWRASSSRASER
jgi:uncharacterized protein HemX